MKYIYSVLLLLISSVGFSQTKGITYQAVILNPVELQLPGVNHTNAPLANTEICLKFGIIDQNAAIEYLETIQTTTDEFGMVNLIIGTGTKIGGYANAFSDIVWSSEAKNLYNNNTLNSSVQLIKVHYYLISDSMITIKDEELKNILSEVLSETIKKFVNITIKIF